MRLSSWATYPQRGVVHTGTGIFTDPGSITRRLHHRYRDYYDVIALFVTWLFLPLVFNQYKARCGPTPQLGPKFHRSSLPSTTPNPNHHRVKFSLLNTYPTQKMTSVVSSNYDVALYFLAMYANALQYAIFLSQSLGLIDIHFYRLLPPVSVFLKRGCAAGMCSPSLYNQQKSPEEFFFKTSGSTFA